jgi:hypothetical protein
MMDDLTTETWIRGNRAAEPWAVRFADAGTAAEKIGLVLQQILIQIRWNATPFKFENITDEFSEIKLHLTEPDAGDRRRILGRCPIDPEPVDRGMLEAALLWRSGLEVMVYFRGFAKKLFSCKNTPSTRSQPSFV